MDITIKIDSVCLGGGHINMTVTKNGTVSKKMVIRRDDLSTEPDEYEDTLIALLRSFVKKSGLINMTQIKTAIESEVFKL